MGLHIKVKNNLNFNCILVVSISVLNGEESSKITMRKRNKKKERIKPITLLIMMIMMILGKIEKGKEKIKEKMDGRSVWLEGERERKIVEPNYFLFGPAKT